MGRVVQSRLAIEDLHGIWEYIAADNLAAADGTIAKLNKTFALLADTPLAGEQQPQLGRSLRRFVVGPYLIFYEPIDDGIHVVRIFHGSRRYEELL